MDEKNVYTFERSETEEIRLTLREYKGKQYIDIRIFFQPKDSAEMIPTKKGLTLTVPQIYELTKGLRELTRLVSNEECVR